MESANGSLNGRLKIITKKRNKGPPRFFVLRAKIILKPWVPRTPPKIKLEVTNPLTAPCSDTVKKETLTELP